MTTAPFGKSRAKGWEGSSGALPEPVVDVVVDGWGRGRVAAAVAAGAAADAVGKFSSKGAPGARNEAPGGQRMVAVVGYSREYAAGGVGYGGG